MNFEKFLEEMKEKVQEYMGEKCQIDITHVIKNNGIKLSGLIIADKGQSIFPTIYLNDLYYAYQNGRSLNDIVMEIAETYQTNKLKTRKGLELEFFRNYESTRDKVVFKLINYGKNMELLKGIPYLPFCNLAIVFYCNVSGDMLENGTILIHNSHLKSWNIEVQQLCEDAVNNAPIIMPAVIQTMEEVMQELLGGSPGQNHENWSEDREPSAMYVLTNSERLYGAACLLYPDVIREFADKIKHDLYLLPSSVHEIIIIPDNGSQESLNLLKMVTEINDTQVDPEEVLASAVYYYDREEGKINLLEKIPD